MPPRRKTNRHLPPCVYHKHGGYYLVRANRWRRLGTTLAESLAEYARLCDTPGDTMPALLDRAYAEAIRRGISDSTRSQYEVATRKLKAVLAEFRPDQVRPRDIAQIMDAWSARPNMANRCLSVLRQAFAVGVRIGACESNPCRDIQRLPERKRDRLITDAEYAAIYAAAPPALRCIMAIAYHTAQRIGDVLAIQRSDLLPEGIAFRQAKTGKRLIVAWTPGLRAAVDDAKNLYRVERMLLLAQRNGRPRSYRGVRDLWARACERAGVQNAHLHDLRAKALTDAKRQGLDATALAGHSTEGQTVRYLRDREAAVVQGPRS